MHNQILHPKFLGNARTGLRNFKDPSSWREALVNFRRQVRGKAPAIRYPRCQVCSLIIPSGEHNFLQTSLGLHLASEL